MIVTEREREAETQAEGEAGSMHRDPDVGFDPGSPGSRPGPKAGAKPLRHPGIPLKFCLHFDMGPSKALRSILILIGASCTWPGLSFYSIVGLSRVLSCKLLLFSCN